MACFAGMFLTRRRRACDWFRFTSSLVFVNGPRWPQLDSYDQTDIKVLIGRCDGYSRCTWKTSSRHAFIRLGRINVIRRWPMRMALWQDCKDKYRLKSERNRNYRQFLGGLKMKRMYRNLTGLTCKISFLSSTASRTCPIMAVHNFFVLVWFN